MRSDFSLQFTMQFISKLSTAPICAPPAVDLAAAPGAQRRRAPQMAHEQTATNVALVQPSPMHARRGTCGDTERENAHFVQDHFTGGGIHKLKIQILEGEMSKIGLQKLTVLMYPPLMPPLVGPFKLARP